MQCIYIDVITDTSNVRGIIVTTYQMPRDDNGVEYLLIRAESISQLLY